MQVHVQVQVRLLMYFMSQVDVDGNGKLDFKEFILLMTTHFDSINAECELKTAFQVIK